MCFSDKLNDNNFKRHLLIILLLILLLFVCRPANAYNWEDGYGGNLTLGYDDNFRLNADDEIETTSTGVGVFADITGTTEVSTIRLALAANGESFSDSSIDDQTDYSLSLQTSRSGERLSSFFDVFYESQPTTTTELLDTGFLESDGTRDLLSATPGLRYGLDERNSISASLTFQDVSYDTVSLTEYTDNSISVGWIHQLNETSSFTTSIQFGVYDPEDEDETDTTALNVSYGYRASEATTYNFTVGYTEVERPETTEDGSSFAINVNHEADERNRFSLTLSNSFEPSGEGNVREEDRLNLGWFHALSDRTQATLSAEGVRTDERDYYSFESGINYQYTRNVVLFASYRYRERDEGAGNANSSTLLFTLSYTAR